MLLRKESWLSREVDDTIIAKRKSEDLSQVRELYHTVSVIFQHCKIKLETLWDRRKGTCSQDKVHLDRFVWCSFQPYDLTSVDQATRNGVRAMERIHMLRPTLARNLCTKNINEPVRQLPGIHFPCVRALNLIEMYMNID